MYCNRKMRKISLKFSKFYLIRIISQVITFPKNIQIYQDSFSL